MYIDWLCAAFFALGAALAMLGFLVGAATVDEMWKDRVRDQAAEEERERDRRNRLGT